MVAIWIWATGWSATGASARTISAREICATCIGAISIAATSGRAIEMACSVGGVAFLISARGEQRSRTAVSAETHGITANVETITVMEAVKRSLHVIGSAASMPFKISISWLRRLEVSCSKPRCRWFPTSNALKRLESGHITSAWHNARPTHRQFFCATRNWREDGAWRRRGSSR